ncbi:NAD(P)-dependent oxidoreductase [Ruegeria hyattellae]|uniref:NAD(P)-dependent oxidoreductase n=1 Tax=Ruegeria hyattellae TaxID=3233337 RepID=UPI00355B36A7
MTDNLIFMDPFPRNEAMVYTPYCAAALADMGRVVAHWGSRAPDDLVEAHLAVMTILIGQTAMPKERLDRAPNLRAILNVKANWEDNIDYSECHARGIQVLSAAPAMAPAVAEFCLAQAITLLRELHLADPLFRAGREAYGVAGNGSAKCLYGAEVAMIGYGNLGRALAPLLRPFGVRLMVHDPWLSDGFLRSEGLEPVSLETALSGSDVLFLLAGVTSDNEGFLGRPLLETIRDDATVVLASRAGIVEFNDFLALAGAGAFRAAVDVYPEEPVPDDSQIRTTPNVLFSAHLAGGLHASYARIREMMLDDIGQILKGLPPLRMQKADPKLAAKMRSR